MNLTVVKMLDFISPGGANQMLVRLIRVINATRSSADPY